MTIHRFTLSSFAALVLALVSASSWMALRLRADAIAPPSAAAARPLAATARLVFKGTSTLHDFEGRVMSQPFVVLLSSNAWSAQGEVIGGEMTTFQPERDRNMWKMLATNSYPSLSGAVRHAPLPPTAEPVTLTLQIRDRQLEVPVRVSGWSEDAQGVRFHAAFDVSLKGFGLKPPSVLGVIRVGDNVHVEADATALYSASVHPVSPSPPSSSPQP